jgi:glycosyltransferase involved in cell wall biosynthesis
MPHPWLSILIPTYNGEAYLSSALDSIILQDDNNVECIVVDDGSTDATLSILNAYQNHILIKVIQQKRQGNWVASTNHALSFARGEYVCLLHQDDLWHKNRLSTMKRLIRRFPGVVFFLHSSCFINGKGGYLSLWRCPLPSYPEIIKPELLIERLLTQNFISIPSPIFKREVALKVGGLDETLWYTADWDFWLKIVAHGDSVYYPKPLSGFRIHANSQTVIRSSHLNEFQRQLERVAKKHLSLWDAPEIRKIKVKRIADFSININTALAGSLHGKRIPYIKLLVSFLQLGPVGQYQYLRNSRIWERVSARIKILMPSRTRK